MKIYNYSDLPVNINGHQVDDRVVYLHNDTSKAFVTHDGYEFLSNHNDASRLETYTIINDTSGYKYYVDALAIPDAFSIQIILISCFSFIFLIKIVQKLKTR